MERVNLKVKLREDMSRHHLKEMRRHGVIPGSLYGKGIDTVPLEVGLPGLADALRTEAGVHALMDLNIEDAKRGEGGTAVIKAIQKDPLTRKLLHIDFERVALSDVITSQIAVTPVGDAIGSREGGMQEQVLDSIEVKSRADQIPARLEVDITDLQIGQFVHASDVPLPEGVELASKPDSIVIAMRPPHMHGVPEREEAAPVEEAIPEEGGTPPAESSEE